MTTQTKTQYQQEITRNKSKLVKKISRKHRTKTQATRRKMGNPNSKVDNEVQVVNIQEALARHEDTKQEKYMMQPGSNMEMSQVSFHSDTFFAILLTSAAIVMLAYILYSCLKRGTLCPRGFLDVYDCIDDLKLCHVIIWS